MSTVQTVANADVLFRTRAGDEHATMASVLLGRVRERAARLRLAPDGRRRPQAAFGRGPVAARALTCAIMAASAGASRLPARMVERLAVAGGSIEWAVRPTKRRLLARNFSHATARRPDSESVRRAVRREFVNEALRSADLLWALARPADVATQLRINHRERLLDPLTRGRGVILVGAHVGGWEVVSSAPAALLPVPATAVVSDDWFAWAMERWRRVGLRLADAAVPPFAVAGCLRRGEVVVVFFDLVEGAPRTAWVRLGHSEVLLPVGPATLARLTGAVLVPFVALREAPRRWRLDLLASIPPPEPRSGTAGDTATLQAVADAWSPVLRDLTEHWSAVYPLEWRATRAGSHGPLTTGAARTVAS